jgi:HPt (histidine-containing phosphotransfer) domain-containing protein
MSSFDEKKLNEYFHDEKDILADLIVDFFEELPAMIGPIKSSIQESNADGLQLSAHTLKGSVSNFFAADCVEYAYFLEKMGKDGAIDKQSASETLTKLESSLEVLHKDLVDFSKAG